jgi:hypothetical protein
MKSVVKREIATIAVNFQQLSRCVVWISLIHLDLIPPFLVPSSLVLAAACSNSKPEVAGQKRQKNYSWKGYIIDVPSGLSCFQYSDDREGQQPWLSLVHDPVADGFVMSIRSLDQGGAAQAWLSHANEISSKFRASLIADHLASDVTPVTSVDIKESTEVFVEFTPNHGSPRLRYGYLVSKKGSLKPSNIKFDMYLPSTTSANYRAIVKSFEGVLTGIRKPQ